MILGVPTVVVDTREKDAWSFKGKRLVLQQAKLNVGDYSIRGMQSAIAVERKSVEDLFLTMTRGLERFKRELQRAKDGGMQFLAVIVEGDMQRLQAGSRFSYADPGRVVDLFYRTCVRGGAAPYVCNGRAEAQDLAWRFLNGFWESRPKAVRV